MIGFYRRTLDIALRFRFVTLMVFFATLGVTGYLFVIIPKGFFPQQDTGVIVGITEGAQDISFAEMSSRQQALAKIVGATRTCELLLLDRRRAGRADRQ